VVASGGVVNDTLTGLVWQQQASATTMSWLAAGNYCTGLGSGFRLPTIKELDSLVDLTVTSGATINQTAFPSAPADLYWASTIDAGNPSTYAYCVDFRVSGESGISQMSNPYRARCVHR
jgi:hypothetical protein